MKNNENNIEATQKHPSIEALLTSITGFSRVGAVAEGSCVTCQGNATTFRDEISLKEYSISGMCQSCQDSIFGVSEE